jgi:hypothetical protein
MPERAAVLGVRKSAGHFGVFVEQIEAKRTDPCEAKRDDARRDAQSVAVKPSCRRAVYLCLVSYEMTLE